LISAMFPPVIGRPRPGPVRKKPNDGHITHIWRHGKWSCPWGGTSLRHGISDKLNDVADGVKFLPASASTPPSSVWPLGISAASIPPIGHPCHCEERSDAAIPTEMCAQRDGDCFVAMLLTRNPDTGLPSFVIPAQAGIQYTGETSPRWIPACAGMTGGNCARRTAPVSSRAGLPDGWSGTRNESGWRHCAEHH
jgi:hypothetical protein